MGKTGAGGYGGISTMNQDQRQGKYWPHKTPSTYTDHMNGMVVVHCLNCDQQWKHPRGEAIAPDECRKNILRGDDANTIG